jgi:hypothetical protein
MLVWVKSGVKGRITIPSRVNPKLVHLTGSANPKNFVPPEHNSSKAGYIIDPPVQPTGLLPIDNTSNLLYIYSVNINL